MSEWADISGAALERDRLDYPHDEPCPQCGRRQWTAEHAPETCQACGYTVPRFCVETAGGWQHLISAEDATDAGLDVDRAYCPEHDAPLTEVPAPAVWAEPGPDGGVWVTPVADLGAVRLLPTAARARRRRGGAAPAVGGRRRAPPLFLRGQRRRAA